LQHYSRARRSWCATTGTAAAQGEQGDLHNCAGAVVSSVAGPGFGQGVKGAAQAQLVDNFGLRNCGMAQGQNP
jgi:hypothetical protein